MAFRCLLHWTLFLAKGTRFSAVWSLKYLGPQQPRANEDRRLNTPIKDYFFDKKKVQLFFTLEFHATVRSE
jgi:hypothetical protein